MELILALIGIVYLVVRSTSQKAAINSAKVHSDIYGKFLKEVSDGGLALELTRRVYNPKYEAEINAEIRDVWESLPAIYPVESEEMVTREKVAILLAKRGFLDWGIGGRICYCIEQKRYHVLNVWIKEELNRHGRDVELCGHLDNRGRIDILDIKPRILCTAEGIKVGNTLTTVSRTNYASERERQKKMCQWIERCPHGRDFSVSPDCYDTEEEYRLAVQAEYERWKSGKA